MKIHRFIRRLGIGLVVLAFVAVAMLSVRPARADSFDWTNLNSQNWLTSVKDQFGGTCWAFSAIGVAEARYRLTRNDATYFAPDLSEQQLVWETNPDMGNTVTGGNSASALEYIATNGVVSEQTCPYNSSSPDVGVAPWWPLSSSSATSCWKSTTGRTFVTCTTDNIKSMLKTYGPLVTSVQADNDIFPTVGSLTSAINSGTTGTISGTNHAVAIVGYVDNPSLSCGGYWIIRNSWGSWMGTGGYYYCPYGYLECHNNTWALTGPMYYTGEMAAATWTGGAGTWSNNNSVKWYVTGGGTTHYTWQNQETTANFNASGTAVTISGIVIAHGLNITSGGYTFSGGSLTVTGGGITTTQSATINSPVTIGAPQTWSVASGKGLVVNGALHTVVSDLTVASDGDVYLSGGIDGGGVLNSYGAAPGSIIKSGAGTLYVTGASNTVTGLTVNGGDVAFSGTTLQVNTNEVIDGGTVRQSAGTHNVAGTVTVGRSSSATSTFRVTGGTANVTGFLAVGDSAPGQYSQTGGSVTAGSYTYCGNSSTAAWDMSGGSFTAQGRLWLGSEATGAGTMTISGASTTMNVTGDFMVGRYGVGTVTQNAGTVTVGVAGSQGVLTLGTYGSASGAYNMNGGVLNLLGTQAGTTYATSSAIRVGAAGTGTFQQTGGTVNIASNLVIGGDGSQTKLAFGSYTMDGAMSRLNLTGVVNTGGSPYSYNGFLYVGGKWGAGTFTQNNGYVGVSSGLVLGYGSSSYGRYDLNGGTLSLTSISGGSGIAAFNFGGGTLNAASDLSIAIPMTLTGTNGAATIDTQGFAVAVSGGLSGNGGLNKRGNGTLTLPTANTYAGDTKVYGGSLVLGQSSVLQNSTLDYGGYGGSVSFGSLISITLGGLKGNQDLELDNDGSSGVILSVGNNGQSTTYAGVLSGDGSLLKIGEGTLTLSGANTYGGITQVKGGMLSLGNANALQYSVLDYGNYGGTLSFGTLANAVLGGLQGSQSLALTNANAAAVALSIGASETTATYSGVLSGDGSLTKMGDARLTLSGANTYTGDTKIYGGSLALANASALQNSTLDYNGYGGNLSFATLTASTIGGIKGSQNLALTNTSGKAVALTVGGNNQSTTYSGVLSGAGSLIKQGSGWLTLSGNNSYAGLTTLASGTLELGTAARTPILSGAGIDVQAGSLIFDYSVGASVASTVQGLLATSYATGFVSGQIYCSTAGSGCGLGWMDDTEHSQVVVSYTMFGDCDLGGSVDFTDLTTLLSNYNFTDGAVWTMGDFNYDGSIDFTDLTTLLANYNGVLGSASSAQAVPEPCTLALAALGLVALTLWRSRRKPA